ncbi:MAG: DUF4845 domain-containing protein [Granulosicoccus sp.]
MSTSTYPQGRRQAGLSVTGFMIILSVCAFLGLFALKVVPHYFENWTVSEIADGLVAKPEVLKQSRSKVYQYIDTAFQQNNLWDLKPKDTFQLTPSKEHGYIVSVKYERRTNLLRNIDLVTTFDKSHNGGP